MSKEILTPNEVSNVQFAFSSVFVQRLAVSHEALRGERDAAIAAKEAAERRYLVAEPIIEYFGKYFLDIFSAESRAKAGVIGRRGSR